MFSQEMPRVTLRSRGNKIHCFPRGQSLSVLLYLSTHCVLRGQSYLIPCYTSRLRNRKKKVRKNELLDAYEGFACSTSGSQNELYYRNDTIIVFFLAAIIKI